MIDRSDKLGVRDPAMTYMNASHVTAVLAICGYIPWSLDS